MKTLFYVMGLFFIAAVSKTVIDQDIPNAQFGIPFAYSRAFSGKVDTTHGKMTNGTITGSTIDGTTTINGTQARSVVNLAVGAVPTRAC